MAIREELAVIVGAGGMGMAVARRLAQRHRLLLADRDPERLEACASALRVDGAEVEVAACDVVDTGSVEALGARALASGRFTALVHVVGLSPGMADARTILQVNLGGATHVADHVAPRLAPGGGAVFIASIAAHRIAPEPAMLAMLDAPFSPEALAAIEAELSEGATPAIAYRLSKHALVRLCARRAPELGRAGVRINSLSPGLIATPMGAAEYATSPHKQALFEQTPLGREGALLEVADAVEWLVSARASFVSGVDLLVDGGLLAALRHPPG